MDSEEAAKQIQHAEEVALVLRRNVVQGENRGDEGRWSEFLLTSSPFAVAALWTESGGSKGWNIFFWLGWRGANGIFFLGRAGLNIHAETEKGDNESIKLAGKGTLGGGESAAAAGCGCGSV